MLFFSQKSSVLWRGTRNPSFLKLCQKTEQMFPIFPLIWKKIKVLLSVEKYILNSKFLKLEYIFFQFWTSVLLISQFSRDQKRPSTHRKFFCWNVVFCDFHREGIPKSAISFELFVVLTYFLHQHNVHFFQLGFHWTPCNCKIQTDSFVRRFIFFRALNLS